MVDINSLNVSDPPLLKPLSDVENENLRRTSLKFQHPCHNQIVKKHIKVVSESNLSVCGFQKRDEIIQQKHDSRKFIKVYDTKKKQFN